MKRAFISSAVAAGFLVLCPVGHGAEVDAQDVLFLKQTVESQQETIDGLKRRLAAIESQLAESRREVDTQRRTITTLTKDLVTQDQLHALATKVEQVDSNRINDSKRIFEALKKIAETPAPILPPVIQTPPNSNPPERRSPRNPSDSPDGGIKSPDGTKPEEKPNTKTKPPIELPAESYQHVVKQDETLSQILAAYRKQYGLKTTMAHIEAANPGINPRKLKVDQKVNIPVVK